LAVCGLIAASALLLSLVWGELVPWMLAALGVGLVGLAAAIAHVQAQQAAALLSALVFPTLSLVWCPLARLTGPSAPAPGAPESSHRQAAQWALGMFLRTCLFSWLGALYIIGFLGSTLFMSKTDQFLGIKFAIVLPVIAIFILYWGGVLEGGSAPARWERLKERMAAAMGTPLHTGQVVAFLVVVVVLVVLVARSGNDSAVGASYLELKTRRLMDGILIARPRTKEVLLGHPALFLAFYAAARRWRQWIVPLVSLGAIGQTSLVNTFCHIHTPLTISLFHLINGLWLGAILGWICSVVWDRLDRRGAGGERRGPAPRSTHPAIEPEAKRNGMKRAAPIEDL
ncbi:MAG: DUF5693 family protein, partial [Chloroflexi bacterium]|nr:DUF5693 family protein [Chloroflexota bacterium]